MNVPELRRSALYDIINPQRCTPRALEIGTSTGHSGIWIACGASVKNRGQAHHSRDRCIAASDRRTPEVGLSQVYRFPVSIDAHVYNGGNWKDRSTSYSSDCRQGMVYQLSADTAIPSSTVGGCYVTHNVSPAEEMRAISGARRDGGGINMGRALTPSMVRYLLDQP